MVNLSDDSDDCDEPDCNWQSVKPQKRKIVHSPNKQQHKKHNSSCDEIPSTSTNRYHTLDQNTQEEENQQSVPKPPPIFIPNVENINKMIKNLQTVIDKADFNYKALHNDQIKLLIKSIDSYRKVVKHLEAAKISFHTFQIRQERAFRVVLKGIHHRTSISDIKAELITLGHGVRSVTNVKSRVTKEPLPMFFVDLDPNPNNKSIYEVRYINNAVVKVEPLEKVAELVQCYRCQMYGHTKSYCQRGYRCVKCGMDHPTAECTKSKDTPPTCVHCSLQHTGNYRGCSVYKNLLKRRPQHFQKHNTTNFHNSNHYPTRENIMPNHTTNSTNMPTYSQVVQSSNDSASILKNIELMINKQMELTNTLMNMMSLLISKLCK